MTHRSLAEVRARLEKAAALFPSEPDSPQATYDRYEMVAIAILDSEFDDFREGELEAYLKTTLQQRSLELGLVEFPGTDPSL